MMNRMEQLLSETHADIVLMIHHLRTNKSRVLANQVWTDASQMFSFAIQDAVMHDRPPSVHDYLKWFMVIRGRNMDPNQWKMLKLQLDVNNDGYYLNLDLMEKLLLIH